MKKLVFCGLGFLAAALFVCLMVPDASAQPRGGGGRVGGGSVGRPSGGAASHFGSGSVVHRDFSPPSGANRPALKPSGPRPGGAPNFPGGNARPNLPNIPSRPDFAGGLRPEPGHRPDTGRPDANHRPDTGRPDANHRPDTGRPDANHRPDTGRPDANHRPDPGHRDGPDWQHWTNIDKSKIHNTVINKIGVDSKTINRIRDDFHHGHGPQHYWSDDWFRHHPDAWHPHGPPPGPPFWWHRPSWDHARGWFAAGFFTGLVADAAVQPIPYYYGSNIVYEGETVYINNVPYVDADEYYQQARDLADAGATLPPEPAAPTEQAESDWLAMGTFAVARDGSQEDCKRIVQIATDKHGHVRGNLVDTETDKAVELYGSVDSKTQRVAFKVEGNDDVVVECGLWNLTQDTVPLLIHVDKNRTEERTLVRLQDSAGSEPPVAP